MAKDYYAILGVSKSASLDEIKKAFRKLAHQHHPDKGGGDEAKFKEINEAYQVLSHSEKRKQYDQFGQTFNGQEPQGGGQGFGGFDFNDFASQGFDFGGSGFEDIFSDIFSGRTGRRGGRRSGMDIQVDVEMSFEEMVKGAKREIRLRKLVICEVCQGSGGKPGSKEENCKTCQGQGQVRRTVQSIFGAFSQVAPCETCRGKGKVYAEKCSPCQGAGRIEKEETISVDIPAGINDEQVVSVPGKGAAGEAGAPAGDLYITVHVERHSHLVRRGDDIVSQLEITFPQAALGDKVTIETIEGPVTMKIPSGTQSGEVFRIRGKGVPHLGRYGRGDHLVAVKLVVPKKLSSEEKKAIEALREAEKR